MPHSPPASVGPTFKAIQALARDANANSPLNAKHLILVERRIAALKKRNKRWAAISTLLVTGSVAAAVALAKSKKEDIPGYILAAAPRIGRALRWSGSAVVSVLKQSAAVILGQMYVQTLMLPLTMVQRRMSRPPTNNSNNRH